MGLLEELKNLKTADPTCKAAEVLGSLPKEEFELVKSIMESPDGNISALARILNKNGYSLSSRTLLRHRNRHAPNKEGCQCP